MSAGLSLLEHINTLDKLGFADLPKTVKLTDYNWACYKSGSDLQKTCISNQDWVVMYVCVFLPLIRDTDIWNSYLLFEHQTSY